MQNEFTNVDCRVNKLTMALGLLTESISVGGGGGGGEGVICKYKSEKGREKVHISKDL